MKRAGHRECVNDTDVPEHVHFHGLLIPSDVDGAEEKTRSSLRAAAATGSRRRPPHPLVPHTRCR